MDAPPSSERKPKSPRPESTMALKFSDVLDGAFGLTPEIETLNDTVEQKKEKLTSQNQELVELEARIRAAENRLARAEGQRQAPTNNNSNSSSGGAASSAYKTTSSSQDYARQPSANDSMTSRAARALDGSRSSEGGSSQQSPRARRNTRDK